MIGYFVRSFTQERMSNKMDENLQSPLRQAKRDKKKAEAEVHAAKDSQAPIDPILNLKPSDIVSSPTLKDSTPPGKGTPPAATTTDKDANAVKDANAGETVVVHKPQTTSLSNAVIPMNHVFGKTEQTCVHSS